MSVKTQEKYMRRLAELLSQDLSYIHGERESGPNGAKKEYLHIGKVFLRALAKDLGLVSSKVDAEPGGIAVAGDISLIGMWGDGNGIFINIHENLMCGCILYRKAVHMKDFSGGQNQHLSKRVLQGTYQDLLRRFLELKDEEYAYGRAS